MADSTPSPVKLGYLFEGDDRYKRQEKACAVYRLHMEGTPRLHAERSTWLPPQNKDETLPYLDGTPSIYDQRVERASIEPFFQRAAKRTVAAVLGKHVILEPDVPEKIRGQTRDEGVAAFTGGDRLREAVLDLIRSTVAKVATNAIAARVVELCREGIARLFEGVGAGPEKASRIRRGRAPKDGWAENIDLCGNDLTNFMRGVALDAAGDAGYSAVLVDHPPVREGAKKSDLADSGLRPYWRHYKARDIPYAEPEMVNGRERAKEVRLFDAAPAGYERVRVLKPAPINPLTGKPAGWATYEVYERKKGDGDNVTRLEGGSLEPHQEIPLRPWYWDRVGFFEGRNMYLELAWLNLRHTRQESDIADSLRRNSAEILHRMGATPEELQQKVDGNRIISTKEGSAAWLARGGTGVAEYGKHQLNIEAKMQWLGNEPHIQRTGADPGTATGRGIDYAEAHTEIQALIDSAEDFIEELLMLTAAYLPEKPSGGSVTIHEPPLFMPDDSATLNTLIDFHLQRGFPTLHTLGRIMLAQGKLPDDLDLDAEVAAAEGAADKRKAAVEAALAKLKAEQPSVVPAQPMPEKMDGGGDMGTGGVQ